MPREHLQRDVAAQPHVGGAVDVAHPAAREQRGDAVRTDDRPGLERPVVAAPDRGAASTKAGVSRKPSRRRSLADELVGLGDELGLIAPPAACGGRSARSGRRPARRCARSESSCQRSAFMATSSRRGELAIEPGARGVPVVDHGARRHAQRLGRLLDAEPAEEPQLDDLARPRVDRRERLERALERDDVDAGVRRRDIRAVERPARRHRRRVWRARRARAASTSTRRIIAPSSQRSAPGSAQPHRPPVEQAQVRLLHEVRRLPAAGATLTGQQPARHLPAVRAARAAPGGRARQRRRGSRPGEAPSDRHRHSWVFWDVR